MKVVHVIVGLRIGGAEKSLQRLVTRLNGQLGQIHEVVSLTKGGAIADELKRKGVNVVVIPADSLLGIILLVPRLIVYFRRASPDVVQTWMYHADFFGGIAAKIAGVKSIFWGVRTTDPEFGSSKITLILRRICSRLSYHIPNKIICVAFAAKEAHINVGYDPNKMVVINNGMHVLDLEESKEKISNLRSVLGIPSDALVVGSIARFNKAKNHAHFIKSMKVVMEAYSDVYALMIGRDVDRDNPGIKELILESAFSDRFIVLGERDDISNLIKVMDVFCMHSLTEGFPNVVAEAMALGRPCVVTDVGDAAHLVSDTGLVVPVNDSQSLANALKSLIYSGPEERNKMGQEAHLRMLQHFSVEKMVSSFSKVYTASK